MPLADDTPQEEHVGDRDVLRTDPHRVEQRDLVGRPAAPGQTGDDLSDRADDVGLGDRALGDRPQQVARLRARRRPVVDPDRGPGHGRTVDLALAWPAARVRPVVARLLAALRDEGLAPTPDPTSPTDPSEAVL